MALSNWLPAIHKARRRGNAERRRLTQRPMVQALEDRAVPSTFWVTNRNDGGAGSLRQAVLDANGHAGGDTIKFRHPAEGTITLTSGELSITGELRIDGPGADHLTVSGGGTSRVFNVASGVSVRIDDVTISNGLVQGANGGGILNAGNLTLNDSVITGCSAGGGGGGIANTGNLTVDHSKFDGNSALGNGGGLRNEGGGTALLDHTTVSGNRGHDAAGITNALGSTLTVQNSLITGNHSDFYGTGAIASVGPLNIINTTISENTGAIPAIWLPGDPNIEVVIRGSRIVHNRPGPQESFVFAPITSTVHLRIEDTTISDNIGDQAGAIEFDFGSLEIVNSTISRNSVMGTSGVTAGAISSFGQLTLIDSTVSDNIGTSAGGILSAYGLEITGSTISGNTAKPRTAPSYNNDYGGGILAFGPTAIDNSTISGNTVVGDGMVITDGSYALAGGIVAFLSGVTIDHSTIAFNRVTDAPPDLDQVSGGVVSVSRFDSDVNVRNTIVASNSATGRDPDVNGSFVSQGHNLIGVLTDNATGFVASDLRGTTAVPLDPRLEPLRKNGGPTQTHRLRHDSPAINAGDNSDAPPTDQRGHTRIVGGTIDIGSYESNHGGHEGPMAGMSVNPPASEADKLEVTALVGVPWRRLPEIRISINSDEQFGSRRETPNWFWMDVASKRATPQGPLDGSFAIREFDFDNAVFVGSVT